MLMLLLSGQKNLPESREDAARKPQSGPSQRPARRRIGRSLGPHRNFFRTRAVLMGAHNGAVNHRIFVVRIGGEVLKNAERNTKAGPAAEPAMAFFPSPKRSGRSRHGFPASRPRRKASISTMSWLIFRAGPPSDSTRPGIVPVLMWPHGIV